MDERRRSELDILLEGALKDFVSNEAPRNRVWSNIRQRVEGRSQQARSRLGYLRDLGREAIARGADIGATARILLASLYIRSNGEEWTTERLIVARRSAGPPHCSIHY